MDPAGQVSWSLPRQPRSSLTPLFVPNYVAGSNLTGYIFSQTKLVWSLQQTFKIIPFTCAYSLFRSQLVHYKNQNKIKHLRRILLDDKSHKRHCVKKFDCQNILSSKAFFGFTLVRHSQSSHITVGFWLPSFPEPKGRAEDSSEDEWGQAVDHNRLSPSRCNVTTAAFLERRVRLGMSLRHPEKNIYT